MRFRLTLREKNTAERSPSLLERQANCAERRGCQGCEAPPSAAARDLSRAALDNLSARRPWASVPTMTDCALLGACTFIQSAPTRRFEYHSAANTVRIASRTRAARLIARSPYSTFLSVITAPADCIGAS